MCGGKVVYGNSGLSVQFCFKPYNFPKNKVYLNKISSLGKSQGFCPVMHMSIFVSKCVSIHMLHIFSIEKVHNTEATQSFFQEYKVLGAV